MHTTAVANMSYQSVPGGLYIITAAFNASEALHGKTLKLMCNVFSSKQLQKYSSNKCAPIKNTKGEILTE